MSIRVAIVEDDVRIRRALIEMLKEQSDCALVAAFASGEKAIEGLSAARPDVVIMDINLPGMNGVECVKHISCLMPRVQIVMLTVYQDTDTIFKALAAGAHGYLIKPVMSDELVRAIRELHSGGAPMTGAIARKVVDAFRQPVLPAKSRAGETLAPRELEVLVALSKGFSYKEIAERLSVSRTTVDTYIQRIYQKLHVHSRSEAVAGYLGL